MNDIDETIKQELAADGSNSGVEEELYDPCQFDSEKISISPRRISLSNVIKRSQSGLIHAADLQRRVDLWDIGKKSRLIESLMLKIPLPFFYAAENRDDQLFIVDGLQRLSAIRGYVLDKNYKLKSLEFLKNLENKYFDEIPEYMQIRINETELDFAVIGPDSTPGVQRNIFKRLNTGGLPLTEQEIRHALYFGPVTELLARLADSNEFQKAVDNSVNDSRMAAQELILRFLSFTIMDVGEYRKDNEMDSFLSDAMQILNELIKPDFYSRHGMSLSYKRNYSTISLEEMEQRFFTAMTRAEELFENCAFRITTPEKNKAVNRRSPINRSLFELWSVVLSNMSKPAFETLKRNKMRLFNELDKEFYALHSPLRNYIGKDSQKIIGVRGRYSIIHSFIQKANQLRVVTLPDKTVDDQNTAQERRRVVIVKKTGSKKF